MEEEESMLLLLEAEAGEVWISFLCLVGGECMNECERV
jgi:hypothetical protein